MASLIPSFVPELEAMKRYPESLYYKGSLDLLAQPKISIVGTRRPNPYTRAMTFELSKKLSQAGLVIVSGAAAGVDALAHEGAGASRTIAVMPCGIHHRYPTSNAAIIEAIEKNGLVISQFEPDFLATNWSFVIRNEIVVALGDALIVTEADMGSGSMRSVEYALEMGKKIYVLPHRLGESEATHRLLSEGKATAIEDINAFVAQFGVSVVHKRTDTPFIAFCRTSPTYEDAVSKFPSEIFEAELSGVIEVRNGRVSVV